jgi:hypothetical protein
MTSPIKITPRSATLAALAAGAVALACARTIATGSSGTSTAALPAPVAGARAATPDARVGLRGGWWDAGEAIWNMTKVSSTRPAPDFIPPQVGDSRVKASDLAFRGNLVFQGNYGGWQAFDISDIRRPVVKQAYVCPGAQGDVSVYGNLLFVSHEATSGRVDCGLQGVSQQVSRSRPA